MITLSCYLVIMITFPGFHVIMITCYNLFPENFTHCETTLYLPSIDVGG
jgi:hypothetical protein